MELIWIIILSALLTITLIVLLYFLIKYYSVMSTLKDMTKKIHIASTEETNSLVSTYSNDKRVLNLAKEINYNLKYTKDLRYRIKNEEQKLVSTITNLSHDLRTPITSVLGYTNLLSKEGLTDNQKKYVDVINSRIIILKEIVDELYEYSLAYEERDLKLEKCNVITILENTLLAFYSDFEAKGFEVKIDLNTESLEALVDPFELKRVFVNIIGNALKYGNSLFSVNLKEREFIFTNRVEGIDSIDVEQIFDRFFTVAKSRTNGSTGLGLSISKKLIEKMNGSLSAKLNGDELSIILKI